MTSVGNPEKLSQAKVGISSGFLGAAILLLAVLIFRTINPQLIYLEPADVKLVKPIIPAGVYLCNYYETKIPDILGKYLNEQTQVEAAKKFSKIIDSTTANKCFRLQASDSLGRYSLEKNRTYSLFVVPEYNPRLSPPWEYNYGIVLHERDNRTGKCKLFPEPGGGKIYGQIANYSVAGFEAKSFTVFKKSAVPENDEARVRVWEGQFYNQVALPDKPVGQLAGGEHGIAIVNLIAPNEFSEITSLGIFDRNIRSFAVYPRERIEDYFVIFKGVNECLVGSGASHNLMAYNIGRCKKESDDFCEIWTWGWTEQAREQRTAERILNTCVPCMKSVILIQGRRQ